MVQDELNRVRLNENTEYYLCLPSELTYNFASPSEVSLTEDTLTHSLPDSGSAGRNQVNTV
jgi:hypothetical protein